MKWEKLGRVFVPDGSMPWAKTHAYVPTAIVRGDEIRIYAAFWNSNKIKRIGFVDVSAKDPTQVLRVSAEPVLDIGEPGTFDSDGVMPSCVLDKGNEVWLYYVGWQELVYSPSQVLFAGLAISNDEGNTFNRYQQTPILERIESERFIRSTSFVLEENGGYRCWYTSANKIINISGHEVPSYTIRHALSLDGIIWSLGFSCLYLLDILKDPEEFGLSRPWIIKENGLYKMFYSVRKVNKGYSLGYAESKDGYFWERKDNEIGIEKSKEGWDSEMVCFPSVVDYEGNRYMFYNGNNYGETGFGVAVLEEA